MPDNLAAAIARAKILEKELARNPIWPVGVETSNASSKPRDVEYLGTMFEAPEPMPAPERLYLSMGANGVRMFTADSTREHDAQVTVYVKRAALDEVVDALAVTLHCLKLSYPETLPFSNTTVMGCDVSTILTKYWKPS